MQHLKIVLLAGLLATGSASGQNVDNLFLLNQGQFRLLSEDLGGAFSYHPQTPAEPLGFPGLDIGVAVTGAKLKNREIAELASSESVESTILIPTVRANVGLPLRFDVGAMYAWVPDSDIRYYGGELRFAILRGDAATPAIGLRGSFTKVTGVDQLDLDTRGLDLSISKGFGPLTPYAGFGKVWVDSVPKGVPTLQKEEFDLNKVFVGLGMNFAGLNINLEADKTGDVPAYSLKLGLRF
ncbi:MAG: hypothetical protein ACRET6_08325 [Burkholderiales bacterium]